MRGRATINVTLSTFILPLQKKLGIWTPINLYTINGIIDSVSASFPHVKFVEPESNHFQALSLKLIQSQINALVIGDFIDVTLADENGHSNIVEACEVAVEESVV